MGKKIGKGGKKVGSKAAVVAPASAGVVAPPAGAAPRVGGPSKPKHVGPVSSTRKGGKANKKQ